MTAIVSMQSATFPRISTFVSRFPLFQATTESGSRAVYFLPKPLFNLSRSMEIWSNFDQVSASWMSEFWSLAIVPKVAGDGGGALNPLRPVQ